jgi:hypothetical protein
MIADHINGIRIVAHRGSPLDPDYEIVDIYEIAGDRHNWYFYWGMIRDRSKGANLTVQNPNAILGASFLSWSERFS